MNKPSWFQPLTLIPAAMAIASVSYALVAGVESKHPTQAIVLLGAIPALALGLAFLDMYNRKRWLDRFVWYPTYGFMIDTENEGYLPPAEEEFDTFVASVAKSWAPFHPSADRLLRSRVKWLYFRKGMDEKPVHASWGLVKGITVQGGSTIYVDYNFKLDPIEKTALAHELGHVIHGLATGTWDQEEHHAFAKKNHLR